MFDVRISLEPLSPSHDRKTFLRTMEVLDLEHCWLLLSFVVSAFHTASRTVAPLAATCPVTGSAGAQCPAKGKPTEALRSSVVGTYEKGRKKKGKSNEEILVSNWISWMIEEILTSGLLETRREIHCFVSLLVNLDWVPQRVGNITRWK